jgi:Uma2 family endonuclease
MATTSYAKTWTYEDLLTLPDDGKRYEIIDGELFEMPAPTFEHSTAVMNLIALFLPVVTSLGGLIRTAPLDVFMQGADPMQPDIVILLPDRLHLIRSCGIEGPPNLVVEVLSPSNPEHDRIRKRLLYARGGVDEYWLASPEAAIIEVWVREGNSFRLFVRAGGEEPVRSKIFGDLSFPASVVFATTLPR